MEIKRAFQEPLNENWMLVHDILIEIQQCGFQISTPRLTFTQCATKTRKSLSHCTVVSETFVKCDVQQNISYLGELLPSEPLIVELFLEHLSSAMCNKILSARVTSLIWNIK